MSDILKLAEQLGQAIAASPQSQALDRARQQAQGDSEAMRLMGEFQSHAERVSRMEQQHQPIGPDDKRKFESLQSQVASNVAIKRYSEAQMDFVHLMDRVSRTIRQQIGHAGGPEEAEE